MNISATDGLRSPSYDVARTDFAAFVRVETLALASGRCAQVATAARTLLRGDFDSEDRDVVFGAFWRTPGADSFEEVVDRRFQRFGRALGEDFEHPVIGELVEVRVHRFRDAVGVV